VYGILAGTGQKEWKANIGFDTTETLLFFNLATFFDLVSSFSG